CGSGHHRSCESSPLELTAAPVAPSPAAVSPELLGLLLAGQPAVRLVAMLLLPPVGLLEPFERPALEPSSEPGARASSSARAADGQASHRLRRCRLRRLGSRRLRLSSAAFVGSIAGSA